MFLLLFLLVVLFFGYHFWFKRRGLPPGPLPWPLVGLMGAMQKNPYGCFAEWRRQFGPVFTFWMAEQPVVVLADFETIHEAMVEKADVFSTRFNFGKQMEIFSEGEFGVIDTNGTIWREQRRFILTTFRDFGLGKNLMQTRIHEQIGDLFADVRAEREERGSVDLPALIERCVGSVICRLLFGHPFEREFFDVYTRKMHAVSEHFFSTAMMVALNVDIAPKLPYFSTYYRKFVNDCETFRRSFDHELAEHKRRVESGEVDETNADDFVYVYLNKIRKESGGSSFSERMLRGLIADLAITGQETTSATLVFLVIYVLNQPHVQQEIHRELDEKIGSERLIEMADRPALVYLSAVINETQRLHNLLPMNLMRKTSKEATVGGHRIPANTAVVPQISTVLFDEKVLPEPMKFKPERFLDENGKLKHVEELIPFSAGKRVCLGESLARMELFLITANLFNRFRIEPEDAERPPSTEKIVLFNARYHPFRVRMSERLLQK